MSSLSLMKDLSLLSILIYETVKLKFPHDEIYNTSSQLKRAIISVRLNIREGNSFYDGRKKSHFEVAFGSLNEVDECMIVATEMKWITDEHFERYRAMYWLCLNKLKKLISSLNSRG